MAGRRVRRDDTWYTVAAGIRHARRAHQDLEPKLSTRLIERINWVTRTRALFFSCDSVVCFFVRDLLLGWQAFIYDATFLGTRFRLRQGAIR